MKADYAKFRNPMDERSIYARLEAGFPSGIYDIAVRAAGHQSAFTVDKLSRKLREVLPALCAKLAAEVEAENLAQMKKEASV